MGLYNVVTEQGTSPSLPWVAAAKTYTLYQRGGLWYVNFRVNEKQVRLSTGCNDCESARSLVESFRKGPLGGRAISVNDKHLYRMIERSRYRNRHKGIPFNISINDLRAVVARCKGYCEVSGHPLDDKGPFRPSLDRIDPALGYVVGNIRIVCLVVNTAMLHFGEHAFADVAISYCRTRGLLSIQP